MEKCHLCYEISDLWNFRHCIYPVLNFYTIGQGCPNLVLEGRCPAEFSSNPSYTHLNQLIKLFLGILETSWQVCWGKLELNSARHRPSRTEFGHPCYRLSGLGQHKVCSQTFTSSRALKCIPHVFSEPGDHSLPSPFFFFIIIIFFYLHIWWLDKCNASLFLEVALFDTQWQCDVSLIYYRRHKTKEYHQQKLNWFDWLYCRAITVCSEK